MPRGRGDSIFGGQEVAIEASFDELFPSRPDLLRNGHGNLKSAATVFPNALQIAHHNMDQTTGGDVGFRQILAQGNLLGGGHEVFVGPG